MALSSGPRLRRGGTLAAKDQSWINSKCPPWTRKFRVLGIAFKARMTNSCVGRRSADAQGGKLNSTQIWLRSCGNLAAPMQGEAAPYRLLSDEVGLPYGLEHTTPLRGIAVRLITTTPPLSILGLIAWAILR